jgi:hypothetical protein
MRSVSIIALALLTGCQLAADGEVSQDEFLAFMSPELSAWFCKADFYVLECFDIASPDCMQGAQTAIADCFQSLRVERPDPLTIPGDTESLGRDLGSCSLKSMERTFAANRRSEAACADQASWGEANGFAS